MLASALASLAIAFNPRLQVLDLGKLKVVLREIDKAKEDVEQLKKEVAEMYGNIDHLKNHDSKTCPPMPKFNSIATVTATMNYVEGCVTRERERLARIFVMERAPDELSKAIMDGSLDNRVFQWAPAARTLDMPPRSFEELRREREQAEQSKPTG